MGEKNIEWSNLRGIIRDEIASTEEKHQRLIAEKSFDHFVKNQNLIQEENNKSNTKLVIIIGILSITGFIGFNDISSNLSKKLEALENDYQKTAKKIETLDSAKVEMYSQNVDFLRQKLPALMSEYRGLSKESNGLKDKIYNLENKISELDTQYNRLIDLRFTKVYFRTTVSPEYLEVLKNSNFSIIDIAIRNDQYIEPLFGLELNDIETHYSATNLVIFSPQKSDKNIIDLKSKFEDKTLTVKIIETTIPIYGLYFR